jgi:hypothetical protein
MVSSNHLVNWGLRYSTNHLVNWGLRYRTVQIIIILHQLAKEKTAAGGTLNSAGLQHKYSTAQHSTPHHTTSYNKQEK